MCVWRAPDKFWWVKFCVKRLTPSLANRFGPVRHRDFLSDVRPGLLFVFLLAAVRPGLLSVRFKGYSAWCAIVLVFTATIQLRRRAGNRARGRGRRPPISFFFGRKARLLK
jgi:hypothetical protein